MSVAVAKYCIRRESEHGDGHNAVVAQYFAKLGRESITAYAVHRELVKG